MLNLDWHFFPVFDRLDPAAAYPGTYNLGLVVTSVAIAILAAFVALSISGRIAAAATPRARYAWASAGAISMGGGIWAMHFVGMLAFSLPCGITYDAVGTLLSMIPGMLASGIALATISKPHAPGLSRLTVSAVLMGAGIAAMHYSGMAAMRPEALLRYDAALVAASVVVAVVLAFVSLSIRFHSHRLHSSRTAATIIAASVMGCAVAGMHYTAMQASIFFPLSDTPTYSMALSPTLLALLITIFIVLIAVSTLVATFAGRQSELAQSLSAEISRRKRTEEELRRSEAYLAQAQRISHTGSWAYDVAARRTTHASEEQLRLYGLDPAAGMPARDDWLQRIHPEDRQKTIDTVAQRMRERAEYEVDFRILHPDCTIKHIHAVGHPVLSSSGDLIEIMGTSTDVTERKRAEYLTEQVFQRLPDLVCILGSDYRFRQANPTYEQIWGIPIDKIIGMHICDVFGREVFERVSKPNLDRCFAGEEVRYAGWFDNHPGGRRYWVVTYSPLRLESERVDAALMVGRDLTEQMLASEKFRDAQIQLAHANRVATIGHLTASIAHEVNQPIGALVTNAYAALRMLKAVPPDLDQASQALGDIVKDGRRVSDVIDRIRALAKKAPPRPRRLDINEVIIETMSVTRGEILKSGVALETQLARDLPPIRGDRVQLQQVVMNLVMNAIEAMGVVDGTRELEIATGKDRGNQIFITVRDSGPPLKPECLDQFFEAFYSTKPTGMGMGLSICRSIIEAHEGRIWATTNVPRGATLHVTLPASEI
jgi:PAS domain S-box-containing protein